MTYREPTHGLGKIMLARHQEGTCGWGCPFCKEEERKEGCMNSTQSRLMTELSRLIGDEELVLAHLENPQWEQVGWLEPCHNWRHHIPEDVQDLWSRLPLEARMVALLMAEEQASAEEWE